MAKRMLIDATHPEETRVVVISGTRLEEFDLESSTKQQIKGNIYLAKVVRVEPSLQAAFIDYGGPRHGFLAFNEIHPDYYQIPIDYSTARRIGRVRPSANIVANIVIVEAGNAGYFALVSSVTVRWPTGRRGGVAGLATIQSGIAASIFPARDRRYTLEHWRIF